VNWTRYEILSEGAPRLPRCAGVYAVYFDDDLVYIGQSCNVANRFYEHRIRYGYAKNIHTPWSDVPETVRITVKVKPSRRLGDWAMWEIRLIARLQPIYNQQHSKRIRA
jgi:excinuclease UvrABC nuclease subunit